MYLFWEVGGIAYIRLPHATAIPEIKGNHANARPSRGPTRWFLQEVRETVATLYRWSLFHMRPFPLPNKSLGNGEDRPRPDKEVAVAMREALYKDRVHITVRTPAIAHIEGGPTTASRKLCCLLSAGRIPTF